MAEVNENTLVKIPDDEYFSIDRISSSRLRLYEWNRELYYLQYVSKSIPESNGTEAMQIGSAVHCLVVEGEEEFAKRYKVRPEFGRTKEECAAKEQWYIDNPGVCELSGKQISLIRGMGKAAKNHYQFQKLLDTCSPLSEQSIFFKFGGLDCKSKLDLIGWHKDRPVLIDLKTTQDARPENFLESVDKYGYLRQMGFYVRALDAVVGRVYQNNSCGTEYDVYIFALDKGFPSRGSLYKLEPRSIDKAISANLETLGQLKDSMADNKWVSEWVETVHRL